MKEVRPKQPWFKAKTYGLGWYPATWQGYAVLFIYVILLAFAAWDILSGTLGGFAGVKKFLMAVFILTLFLLWVCFNHGEPLRWRWGKNTDIEHAEDPLHPR